MRVRRLMALLLLMTPCAAQKPSAAKGPCEGKALYSRRATEDGNGPVTSPDGHRSVAVMHVADAKDPDGQHMSLLFRVGSKRFKARLNGFRSEILWAPDSSAFAVNVTEGGGGFGQRSYIFYVKDSSVNKLDVSRPVEKAFGYPGKCDVRIPPNTAVLAWLDPHRLLVAAEVPNVSVCKYMGTFLTYEVSLPALRVLARHTQKDSKRRFNHYLGCELRSADDEAAAFWQKVR